jgi:hypothetical protein
MNLLPSERGSVTRSGPGMARCRLQGFGVRWQGAAATPLFGRAFESGVALRFPPQSKKRFAIETRNRYQAESSEPL